MFPRFTLVFVTLAALTGCSTISAIGDATTPLDVYEVRAVDQPQARRQVAQHLIVELPTTTGALDTDRIMIRPNPLQAQYLPGVRWSDPTPVMLQTLMLRSIESTNAYSYVGRRPIGAGGDYAILTELVDFQAETSQSDDTVSVRLGITARVLREEDRRIIATRSFESGATAPSAEPLAVVAAFDAAAASLLPAFTDWTLSATGAR